VRHALGRWGSQAALPAQAAPLSADAAVVALQTMFDPGAAGNLDAAYELRLGEQPFAIRVADRRIQARQGAAHDAVATIATDTGTLVSVLWHDHPLGDAIAAGTLTIAGDRRAAEQLLGMFQHRLRPP
jgi:alkyl sulfatase BDS1-like metallo-beta-lactamase superfamily hydrolase